MRERETGLFKVKPVGGSDGEEKRVFKEIIKTHPGAFKVSCGSMETQTTTQLRCERAHEGRDGKREGSSDRCTSTCTCTGGKKKKMGVFGKFKFVKKEKSGTSLRDEAHQRKTGCA